jgi:exodeoxyribonuclease VII large subunit
MSGGFFDFHARVVAPKRQSPASDPQQGAGSAATPPALSITELTAKINGVFRAGFAAPVWVRGEITGYRGAHGSGHYYYSLKDAQNCLNCVCFASDARGIRFEPTNGMEVLAFGQVVPYGAKSQYQLKVTRLLPVGQGALELAFRQLKERLQREGLFAAERKKPMPPFPRRIALVTSRAAAGFADMLKVLRRFSWLKLMLFHVPVQGDAAHPAIAAALAAINRHAARLGGVDAILLGRGGGSAEDLWAFNEEIVARAVADSAIPVITGIGHEVDVSIADLAADYHAHTPTEAAQVLTQNWRAARQLVEQGDTLLLTRVRRLLKQATEQLLSLRRHEAFRRPMDVIVRTRQQRIDDAAKNLKLAVHLRLQATRERLSQLDSRLQVHRPTALLAGLRQRVDDAAARLAERHPRHALRQLRDRSEELHRRLGVAMKTTLSRQAARLDALTRELDAVGPLQVLARGYSITMRRRDRQIIRSVKEIQPGDRMITRFADGEHEWTAGDGQMTLFP